ncbi:MAG: hypothetical protein IPM23_20100 [Candidatus Melainabacteria bacterium]|nr:hypothetical protein [Candidatus Melainabacteria bacterium]
MNRKAIVTCFLLASAFTLPGLTASDKVFAQPDQVETGIGFAEPATGSGVVYPERSGRVDKPVNRLEPGRASPEEAGDIARVMPAIKPRAIVARFADKFADKLAGPAFLQSGRLLYVRSDALKEMFSNRLFYVLRFRVWPVGFDIPEPMKSNNIFVVDSKGKLVLVTGSEQLKSLFKTGASQVKDEKSARLALRAWLELSSELNQDGFLQFSIDDTAIDARIVGRGLVAHGKAVIQPRGGDEGFLSATLTFDNEGRLETSEEEREVKAGMRPICQSTKLLDQDPVVRQMARRDLLILGRRAESYLIEQRKKGSPELQKAIDDIWLEIVRENRR